MTEIVKPSILPGFAEYLPEDQIIFNELLDIIRKNYEKFGFLPIDTPVIEKSEVLLAKGGGETEKQVYRFTKGTTDMSLRFDLTVPLARYVAQHFSELAFPFRRYQIGKVYRGERNQKGRFREFYQCDIDVIGNDSLSLINDAEIPAIIYSIFKELDFGPFLIKINNRKILNGFFQSLEIEDTGEVLRTIDKLDKIGVENVGQELIKAGLTEEKVNKIFDFIKIKGDTTKVFNGLKALQIENELFLLGLEELEKVVNFMKKFGISEDSFAIDLTVARGLDYYTGTVYETNLVGYESIGSVCSGGRYENLAEYYTKNKLPGVGISIGLSRLFYQLKEKNKLNRMAKSQIQVILLPMEDCIEDGISIVSKLRENNIASMIYTESGKLSKKFKFANSINAPYVIVVGKEEIEKKKYTLKNMESGEEFLYSIDEIINCIK